MSKALSAIFSVILSLLLSRGASDPAAQQAPPDESLKLGVELVVMDVQVLEKINARPLGGLKSEDFAVFEDDVRQRITHFSQDKLPLSILLLLDVSGSVRPYAQQIREGATNAIQHLKPEDEVALAAFGTSTKIVQSFTRDRRIIADQIENVFRNAHVGRATFLPEAVYQAAVHLKEATNPASRRVVILVTDNISNQFRFKGHSGGDALLELYESGAVVCGLLVGRTGALHKAFRYHPLLFLMTDSADADTFADRTGGEVLGAGTGEIQTSLLTLIEHLRTRYAIGYTSSNSKRDGKFRKVKIKISPELEKQHGKVAVLTRRGYYAAKGK
jgi:Ca-activated chloride channel family protein